MITVKRELKNIGIKPIEELSVQEKTNIAEKVAEKLSSLNVVGLSHNEILERLFDVKMYTAQMGNNLGKVSYYHKNKTIYFDKNMYLGNVDENILKECINYLQNQTGSSENSNRMGLCTFEKYKVRGKALNEAGISFICNKLLNRQEQNKNFTLLKQILLITGEEAFLESILTSNNSFEEKFIEQINSENIYYKMQNTFDAMSNLEQIINRLNIEGRTSKNPERYISKINMHKHTLNSKFSEMQWEIYNKYFSRKIELVDNLEKIKEYKNELFNFSYYLEISNDEPKYTNFTTEKFKKLNKIEKTNNSMILVQNNALNKIITSIKKMIFKPKGYKYTNI